MATIHNGFNPYNHDLNLECASWRLLVTKFSHDLRTPMSAIANGCESLEKIGSKLLQITEDDGLDSDRLKQRILEMNDTVALMSSTTAFLNMMINRCLDYTLIANGEMLRPQMGEVDLRQAVLTAVNCVESLQSKLSILITDIQGRELTRYGHTHAWQELESFGPLQADRQWLFEALLNLLSNAFKHGINTLQTHKKVHLMIGLEDKAQVLRVSVSDHGEQISREQQQILFSPPKISPAGGARIGLFTMQQRLLVLGGSCGVGSKVDGNTFWFTMPTGNIATNTPTEKVPRVEKSVKCEFELSSKIKEEYEQVYGSGKALSPVVSASFLMKTPQSSDKLPLLLKSRSGDVLLPEVQVRRRSRSNSFASATATASTSWRVLVVDDSLPSLKMTCRLLEGEGHIVTEALNGRVALQLLAIEGDKRFDLVLMDLQMPGMDGFEATTALRHWENQQYNSSSPSPSQQPGGVVKGLLIKDSNDFVDELTLPKVKVHSRCPSPAPGGGLSLLPPLGNSGGVGRSTVTSGKIHAAAFFSSGPSAATTTVSSPRDQHHHAAIAQLPPLPPLTTDRSGKSPVSSHNNSDRSSASTSKKYLIVGCSAATDPILLQEALFVGMDDFVSKPLTLSALSLLAKKHGLPN